jgi:putative ATP-dependent endonuclease of OLD family
MGWEQKAAPNRGGGEVEVIIKSIRVKNFRSIKDCELQCDKLTVLVGPNGSGKSTFLRALELFYTPVAKYSEEDFYNGNTTEPITITVTFTNLTKVERKLFHQYVERDTLRVEKVLAWEPSKTNQKYYGYILQNPDFQKVRTADKANEKRQAYQELIESRKYPELPKNIPAKQIDEELKRWEEAHPETLQWIRDNGQFFGFKEVGESRLERYTRFILIPAVREASEDATEGRGKVISELMDLVVRSTLEQRKDLIQLREKTQKEYEQIMNPKHVPELKKLKESMNDTLNRYAPGAQIEINWSQSEGVQIPMPKADIKVIEDGYPTSVERTGHGLQRAFIMTALQHLAIAQAQKITQENMQGNQGTPNNHIHSDHETISQSLPNLIIGIEEPELYQHPSRQRHIAQVLLDLTTDNVKTDAHQIQIIYATHSPLFVDIKRFHNIRLIRKEKREDDKPKQTVVYQATLEQVSQAIVRAEGNLSGIDNTKNLVARLHTLMSPWTNEGFFADVIVLVEGEEDRAAIIGTAKAMDYDFESMDIAVIPCNGKGNLHKALAIFKSFQIPIFTIWDFDLEKSKNPQENEKLLRMLGLEYRDGLGETTVGDCYAYFKEDLNSTLKEELSLDFYNKLLDKYKNEYGYDNREHARKNPLVIQNIIQEAASKGTLSLTLGKIVEKIVELKLKRK